MLGWLNLNALPLTLARQRMRTMSPSSFFNGV